MIRSLAIRDFANGKRSMHEHRCTIRNARDESTGLGFHLYEELLDEGDCVMLELEGMTFETAGRFAPSGRPEIRVEVRIPKLMVRRMGLLPGADAELDKRPSSRADGLRKASAKGEVMPEKNLKKYVFDAGNSNTGVAGVVIAVRAYSWQDAVKLANDFLRKYQYKPLEIEVDKLEGSVGVDWALFCVGPNLRKRDIDEESVLGEALPLRGKERDE
jgi:hypothetical protein